MSLQPLSPHSGNLLVELDVPYESYSICSHQFSREMPIYKTRQDKKIYRLLPHAKHCSGFHVRATAFSSPSTAIFKSTAEHWPEHSNSCHMQIAIMHSSVASQMSCIPLHTCMVA